MEFHALEAMDFAQKKAKKCGGIQQYVIKILRSIKILEENGYDFYRFEKKCGGVIYEEDKESRLLYIYELIARRMCK